MTTEAQATVDTEIKEERDGQVADEHEDHVDHDVEGDEESKAHVKYFPKTQILIPPLESFKR
jgi:hypothetical protein